MPRSRSYDRHRGRAGGHTGGDGAMKRDRSMTPLSDRTRSRDLRDFTRRGSEPDLGRTADWDRDYTRPTDRDRDRDHYRRDDRDYRDDRIGDHRDYRGPDGRVDRDSREFRDRSPRDRRDRRDSRGRRDSRERREPPRDDHRRAGPASLNTVVPGVSLPRGTADTTTIAMHSAPAAAPPLPQIVVAPSPIAAYQPQPQQLDHLDWANATQVYEVLCRCDEWLPPGWERVMYKGVAVYLDHLSREAYDEKPWEVWARKGLAKVAASPLQH